MIYKKNTSIISIEEIMRIEDAELLGFSENEVISLNEGFFDTIKKSLIKLKDTIIKIFNAILDKIRYTSNSTKKPLNRLRDAIKTTNSNNGINNIDQDTDIPDNSTSYLEQAIRLAKNANFGKKYKSLEQVLEAGYKSPNFVVKNVKYYLISNSMDTDVEKVIGKLYEHSNQIIKELFESDKPFGVDKKDFADDDKLFDLVHDTFLGLIKTADSSYKDNTSFDSDERPSISDFSEAVVDTYRNRYFEPIDDRHYTKTVKPGALYMIRWGALDDTDLDNSTSHFGNFYKLCIEILDNIDKQEEFVKNLKDNMVRHADSISLKIKNALNEVGNEFDEDEYKYDEEKFYKKRVIKNTYSLYKGISFAFIKTVNYAIDFIIYRAKIASKAILSMIRAAYKDMNNVKTESYSSSIFSNLVLI